MSMIETADAGVAADAGVTADAVDADVLFTPVIPS